MPKPHSVRDFQEIASVGAVTFVSQASWLLTLFLLARHLPREGFGYLTLWQYALNLLWAGGILGFQNAILRNWPRERLVSHRRHKLFLPLGTLACMTAIVISGAFHLLYGSPINDSIFLFVAGVGLGFSILPVTILQIFRKFSLAQSIYSLWRPGLFLFTLILLSLGTVTLTRLFVGMALLALLQLTLAVLAAWPLPRGNEPITLRPMIPDALAFTGLHMAALLSLRLDAFTMPKLLDLDSLGLYSATTVWALTGYQLAGTALSQVLNPKLASGEPVPVTKWLFAVITLGTLAGGLLVAFSNWVLPAVFGPQYVGNHRALVAVLALSGLFQTLYVIPSSRIGILSTRRVLYGFAGLSFLSVGVGLLLLIFLVPRFGLTGAALASALTWIWRVAIAWWVAARET